MGCHGADAGRAGQSEGPVPRRVQRQQRQAGRADVLDLF